MEMNTNFEQREKLIAQFREKRAKALKNICLVGIIGFAVSLLVAFIIPILTLKTTSSYSGTYSESLKWSQILGEEGKALAMLLSEVKIAKFMFIINLLAAIAGVAFCGYAMYKKAEDAKTTKIHMILGGVGTITSLLMMLANKIIKTIFDGIYGYRRSIEIKSIAWLFWLAIAGVLGYYTYLGITIFIANKADEMAAKSNQQ